LKLAVGVNEVVVPVGEVQALNSIVSFFSDQRLKDNIKVIANAGPKLYSLQGVFYQQNHTAEQFGYRDYKTRVGVLAQEVQAVLPEAVESAPFDTDDRDQSRSDQDYLTVQYEKIIPLIIETVKEQQLEIEKYQSIMKRHAK